MLEHIGHIVVFMEAEIFFNWPNPSAAPGPGVYSASNRNEYQELKIIFLGCKVRPARKADNLTAISEPIV
jgi:hypothetical protein